MLEPLDLFLLVACRTVVGVGFALAVIGKFRDVRAFEQSIGELVPAAAGLTRPILLVVLAAETTIVVLLASGWWVAAGFAVAAALLVGFSGALAAALRRGRRVSCNCFGADEQPISVHDLVRNGGLLACAVTGLAVSTVGGAAGTATLAESLLAGVLGAAVLALLLHVRELAMLVQPGSWVPASKRSA